MNQQLDEAEVDELIERTRRALSPREADEARVLAALSARLFAAPAGPAADGGREATPLQPRSGGMLRWVWKAVLPFAALGALGLALLPRVDHEPHKARPSTARAPEPPALRAASVELTAPEIAADVPSQTREAAPPSPQQPPKKPPARKKCRAANGGARPCTSGGAAPTALAASAPAAAGSLRLELDALRSAERALREHQPEAALTILEAFERSAPDGGSMQQERQAAATIARCTLAADGGSRLYQVFVERYPGSAYAVRVRQSCQPK